MPTPTRPRRLAADHFRALAAAGLRTPIGTDLVLHERPDPEAVRLDGRRLAGVVREAAERYRTPLAIPLMDLRLEKADLVRLVRPDVAEPDTFHFDAPALRRRPRAGPRRGGGPVPPGAPRAPRRDRRGRGAARPHAPRHGDRPLLARDEAARRPDRRGGPGRPRRARGGRAPRRAGRARPGTRRARGPPLPPRPARSRGGGRHRLRARRERPVRLAPPDRAGLAGLRPLRPRAAAAGEGRARRGAGPTSSSTTAAS